MLILFADNSVSPLDVGIVFGCLAALLVTAKNAVDLWQKLNRKEAPPAPLPLDAEYIRRAEMSNTLSPIKEKLDDLDSYIHDRVHKQNEEVAKVSLRIEGVTRELLKEMAEQGRRIERVATIVEERFPPHGRREEA